jgi:DNA-binding NtrC family response regulator
MEAILRRADQGRTDRDEAQPPKTRRLVVAAKGKLPPRLSRFLEANSWGLSYADSAAAARALGEDQGFLVGLAIFPESRDLTERSEIQQTVFALPRVKWIGALAREDLRDIVTKRFITQRLYDFQVFPLDGERLAMALGHAFGMATIEQEFRRGEEACWSARSGLIGDSSVMRDLYRLLKHAAESDVPVLITGPTGTGKEKAARAIHEHSARAEGPFVALNCAAIPPSLLQAELFGHVKGAFTDASERRIGHIEAAEGGTLFLDEIGDMPIDSQATLLRFLEDKLVTPLGSRKSTRVDVRVIASTNKDLEAAIRKHLFRADLFYRLAVLVVRTPRLSLREGDIELLARHFLDEAIAAVGVAQDVCFSDDALKVIRTYAWPGNLRELRSCVFHAVVDCKSRLILPGDLNIGATSANRDDLRQLGGESLQDARDQSEKRKLELALAINGSNITRTARDLNVSRMTLYRLMAKHGVSPRRDS